MMAAVVTADNDRAGGDRHCQAPSCWEPGTAVEIDGRDVDDDPVLCETHRQAFFGVSS